MTELFAGLALLLGLHSIGIAAEGWRARQIARVGPRTRKAAYSLVSLAGLALIIQLSAGARRYRRRDRSHGVTYPTGSVARDALAVAIGVVASALFVVFLHGPLIGIRRFG